MTWRKIAYILYPLLVGIVLPLLFFLQLLLIDKAHAGIIRSANLTPDKPVTVRLSPGRTTAISFAVRPEKVVPGNPNALEINFLGKDLTVRPLAEDPGNLIVYTKSGRYVILLQLSSTTQYDDVVSVSATNLMSRPIRLLEDSFQIEKFKIQFLASKQSESFSASVSNSGKRIETQEPLKGFRCQGCLIKQTDDLSIVSCSDTIQRLQCRKGSGALIIERVKP